MRKKGRATETGTEAGSKYTSQKTGLLIVVILFCVATLIYSSQNLEYHYNYATITSTTTDAATATVTPATTAAVTVRWPASLVNDKTLTWDPIMYRPWLDQNLSPGKRPPAMLMLSTIGYNQQNQTKALQMPRSIRDTELLNGVINHPWFHPTAWDIIRDEDGSFNSGCRYTRRGTAASPPPHRFRYPPLPPPSDGSAWASVGEGPGPSSD